MPFGSQSQVKQYPLGLDSWNNSVMALQMLMTVTT